MLHQYHPFPPLHSIQKLDDIYSMSSPLSSPVHLFRVTRTNFGATTNASDGEDFSDVQSFSDLANFGSQDFFAKTGGMSSPDALPSCDIEFSLFPDDRWLNIDEQPLTNFSSSPHVNRFDSNNLDIESEEQKEPQHAEVEQQRSQPLTVDGVCSKRKPFIILKDCCLNTTTKKSKRNTGCEVEILIPQNDEDVSQRSSQSWMKNTAGHVIHAMKRSIRDCMKPPRHQNNINRGYIFTVFEQRGLSPKDKGLLEFLKNMNPKWKTWKTLTDYLAKYPNFIDLFMSCIQGFLGSEGLVDFNEWLKKSNKMKDVTKRKIRNDKIYFLSGLESWRNQLKQS